MAAKSQEKAPVVCPRCGHEQLEPRQAISSNCRQCGEYLKVQELFNPTRKAEVKAVEQRRVTCFDCGTELDVPAAAQSAMCKRCSSYLDLKDYTIANAVSKNFKTKGRFVVERKGYVFNTDVVAREIIVKGQVIGKLTAEDTLTIYSTAEIKGKCRAHVLVIPADNAFHCNTPIDADSVEILGEWVGNMKVTGTVRLRSSGRLFGDVEAPAMVIEEGAVMVGRATIKPSLKVEAPAPVVKIQEAVAAPNDAPASTPELPLQAEPRKRPAPRKARPRARDSKTSATE
jgi:cytoskeletal protein CcmA (bactofilin family)/DNA-directed RNA polymerase subunit RPC12/RpoP